MANEELIKLAWHVVIEQSEKSLRRQLKQSHEELMTWIQTHWPDQDFHVDYLKSYFYMRDVIGKECMKEWIPEFAEVGRRHHELLWKLYRVHLQNKAVATNVLRVAVVREAPDPLWTEFSQVMIFCDATLDAWFHYEEICSDW